MRIIRTPHVVIACLTFLGGVAFPSFTYAYGGWVPSVRTVVLVALFAVWIAFRLHVRMRAVVLVIVLAFSFGMGRFAWMTADGEGTIAEERSTLTMVGRVIRVSEYRSGWRALRMIGGTVRDSDTPRFESRTDATMVDSIRRPIDIIAPRAGVAVRYGDTVRVRCSYRPPDRAIDRLTTSGACMLGTWNGSVQVVATGGGSLTIRALLRFRDALIDRVDHILAYPAAGMVSGTLLGVDRSIPESLTEAFRKTGTIHVLVVSGWHMSFIGLQLRRLLTRIGIARSSALWGSLTLVALFTVMVGLRPAAVRGFLMAAAVIAVDLMGRAGNPVRALLLVATAMVAMQPEILGFDLGFQLSLAATAGLLLLQPIIDARFARWWPSSHAWAEEIRMLVTASIAASVATAPLLVGTFGTISPFAPFVNVPVLLLIPPLMYAGIAVLAVAPIAVIALPFAWIATALSVSVVWIVEHAAAVPWSQIMIARFDGWCIAAVEFLLAGAVIVWYRRRGIAFLSPYSTASDATAHIGARIVAEWRS